jgi:hypothetical protein
MRSAIAIFVLVLVLGPSAGARESDYDVSIQEDLDSELAKEKMFDVPVYFHDQPHPASVEDQNSSFPLGVGKPRSTLPSTRTPAGRRPSASLTGAPVGARFTASGLGARV